MPSDAKKFFVNISCDLWNGIADDEDVIDLLTPFSCGQNCKK